MDTESDGRPFRPYDRVRVERLRDKQDRYHYSGKVGYVTAQGAVKQPYRFTVPVCLDELNRVVWFAPDELEADVDG